MNFSPIDWLIVAIYLAVSLLMAAAGLLIGSWFGKPNASSPTEMALQLGDNP